jgi:hypothetical protein
MEAKAALIDNFEEKFKISDRVEAAVKAAYEHPISADIYFCLIAFNLLIKDNRLDFCRILLGRLASCPIRIY